MSTHSTVVSTPNHIILYQVINVHTQYSRIHPNYIILYQVSTSTYNTLRITPNHIILYNVSMSTHNTLGSIQITLYCTRYQCPHTILQDHIQITLYCTRYQCPHTVLQYHSKSHYSVQCINVHTQYSRIHPNHIILYQVSMSTYNTVVSTPNHIILYHVSMSTHNTLESIQITLYCTRYQCPHTVLQNPSKLHYTVPGINVHIQYSRIHPNHIILYQVSTFTHNTLGSLQITLQCTMYQCPHKILQNPSKLHYTVPGINVHIQSTLGSHPNHIILYQVSTSTHNTLGSTPNHIILYQVSMSTHNTLGSIQITFILYHVSMSTHNTLGSHPNHIILYQVSMSTHSTVVSTPKSHYTVPGINVHTQYSRIHPNYIILYQVSTSTYNTLGSLQITLYCTMYQCPHTILQDPSKSHYTVPGINVHTQYSRIHPNHIILYQVSMSTHSTVVSLQITLFCTMYQCPHTILQDPS